MTLTVGTQVGPYEIVSTLGAGGMGEVYRARDTRLDRDVAMKVLPDAFASDPERCARFEREAKTLAALNHPHIAQIYGIEQSGATCALVMELVEGEDLATRIARGAIPVDEALPIARQITEALEAAHEHGVIHRDLKPANIKLRPDGTVKVLDFGLAKSAETVGAAGASRLANSPTFASPAVTGIGMVLGTAAYMSPEQARGAAVDKRADIWAFGVVLMEMLTGRPLFAGESMIDVLGAVVRQPLDLTTLPAATPRSIRRLLRRCLERDPKHRLHDIADARLEIADATESPEGDPAAIAPPPLRLPVLLIVAGMVAVAAITGMSVWMLRARIAPPAAPRAYHFSIPQPEGGASYPVISPDGRQLVSVRGQLWVRALDEGASRVLEGTDGARNPFWSPDSSSIGFFVSEGLKRISVAGGPPVFLSAVPRGSPTGTWSSKGTILVDLTENPQEEGWYLLPAGASSLTKIRAFPPDRPNSPDKTFPFFLPDGEHFLFTHPVGETATLHVGSIHSDQAKVLVAADTRAMFAGGFVFYVRNGTIFAQPFDAAARAITGEAVALMDGVDYFTSTGAAGFSVSGEGTLVFRRGASPSRLQWVERDGRHTGAVLDSDGYDRIDVSNDGQRVLLEIVDSGRSTTDIWVADLKRNVSTRLTSSRRSEMNPLWAPDGSHLVFSADWQGPPNLYLADAAGGPPRVLVPFDRTVQQPGGWTPDGKMVVYETRNDASNRRDIWRVDVATGRRQLLLGTEFDEWWPSVSPDGRWLLYTSNATGRDEVYIRAFPDGSWQERLSTEGARHPVWRRDGTEIFYMQPDGSMMAVQIAPSSSGGVQASRPTRLFGIDPRTYRTFDVGPDGQRFLLNVVAPGSLLAPDEVVSDWARLMKK